MPFMFWVLYLIAGIIISTATNYLMGTYKRQYSRSIKAVGTAITFLLIIPVWPVFAGFLLGRVIEGTR